MINYIKKMLKCAYDQEYRFGIFSSLGFYNNISDEEFLKKKFKIIMKKELNLENPLTYNEKLQWLKLYDRKDEYTKMVDKYEVRSIIKEKIGDEYLIPLLGCWESPNDIDFEKLPEKFVLKCNHNSGLGMCICQNKNNLNIVKVKNELSKGLKENYYLSGREWPYKNVKRKIIAEQFIESDDGLKDYKFYCFNGKVKLLGVYSDRNSINSTKADYFDENYNPVDILWGYEHSQILPSKPTKFEKMKEIAEILSRDFPELRVDLYQCGEKIYFGELTFYDGSGFEKINPVDWDIKMGDWIKLPKK